MAQSEDFPYLVYQEQFGPLLSVIAKAVGIIAADGDADGLAWFEEHVTVLIEEAKDRMNKDFTDLGGGGALPV